jgi:hypothetical protein
MKNKQTILSEKISMELPFTVPENYFEQFALQIDQQIGYKVSSRRFVKSWMYFAAMFVGLFLVGGEMFYSANQRNTAKNSENYESYVLSQVSESTVMDYYVNEPTK